MNFYSKLFAMATALLVVTQIAIAVTYPTVNSTNFPSGTYDDGNPVPLNYRYFIPVNYDADDTNTLYPLVLFLHGAGEKGSDNSRQLNGNANKAMIFISSANPDNQTDYPCFWVAPQCSLGDWGDSYLPAQLQGMLDHFIENYNIDPDRIYITGLSMGGGGTISQIAAYPQRYAAANPICGWFNGDAAPYAHIPLWAFHCADDGVVGVNGSDSIVGGMRWLGGTANYTRYNTGGHGGAWTRAYNSASPLVPWMMAQRRGQKPISQHGPYVNITSPVSSLHASTSASNLAVAGDADADTTSVKTRNDTLFQDGTTSGTTNWNSTINSLKVGENRIYVESETVAYVAPGNGKTTTNSFIYVNRASGGDAVQPVVTITVPTTDDTYSTASSTVDIAGTVTDNVGVTDLSWSNNRGGGDSITIGSSWQYDGIVLEQGANVITITAKDADNNVGIETITVINSTNLLPKAVDDSVTTVEGVALLIDVLANDSDPEPGPQPLFVSNVFSPANGYTLIQGTQILYTPKLNFSGIDFFDYVISDGEFVRTGTVQVMVEEGSSPKGILFQQDFESSQSVADFISTTDSQDSKFDDISAEIDGGSWSIANGSLQLSRPGLSSTDNDGGLARIGGNILEDSALLRFTFEIGIGDIDEFWNRLFQIEIGAWDSVEDYGDFGVFSRYYQQLDVIGYNPGNYVLSYNGVRSSTIPADGVVREINWYLNRSGSQTTYTGPDGQTHSLANDRSDIWIDSTLLFDDVERGNYPGTVVNDFRFRFSEDIGFTTLVDRITVSDVFNDITNFAPEVTVADDVSFELPTNMVEISGSYTDDGMPVNETVTTVWTQVGGPAIANIENPNTVATNVNFEIAGTYVFRLTVDDSNKAGFADISVTVSESSPGTPGMYGIWATNNGLTGADAFEAGDPDGDRIANILEFVFNLDPVSRNSTMPMVLEVSHEEGAEDYMKFKFDRVEDLGDATVKVEVSDDMINWYSGPSYVLQAMPVSNGDGTVEVEVIDRTPLPASTGRFIRLSVE
ncbi:Ig-like domain-containing protein [Rubellicoccus peritrichatus]|uniref:Ig-like domain-containing protein n=1 Tax=Rubellicoccus peritrichatus TaxID=3080537 RepID=A0AAQ3L883_9BACT|nr:Ig-like domain-containing protein [Puniceicoccus sp. CR14]WOO39729.1 Ig-like domain-containing protein [Puniceicoccus sp. CR14]